jgi:hypothetical protein
MGLGSKIRKKSIRITDPGVKKAPDPGSGSATLLFPHCGGTGTVEVAVVICDYVPSGEIHFLLHKWRGMEKQLFSIYVPRGENLWAEQVNCFLQREGGGRSAV